MAVKYPIFTDHDQRFKTLLREFLPQFFELFFPEWGERFDFSGVEWLESELFSDPPEGTRRSVDLVAKLPASEESGLPPEWLSLIHIEVESADSVEPLRRRMHRYYTHLRDRHELPVLPIALYLKVGIDGIGIDEFCESYGSLEVLRFQYLYVGLPALDAIQYLEKNDLGAALSALMKVARDQRAGLKSDVLRLLAHANQDEFRKYLLIECVQTYLTLDDDPEQQAEFERLIQTRRCRQWPRHGWNKVWNKVWSEAGRKAGKKAAERPSSSSLKRSSAHWIQVSANASRTGRSTTSTIWPKIC